MSLPTEPVTVWDDNSDPVATQIPLDEAEALVRLEPETRYIVDRNYNEFEFVDGSWRRT